MTSPPAPLAPTACLYLVPNTLDFGVPVPDDTVALPLTDVLPLGTLQTAARLAHWRVENAKTARAFLKRLDAVCPLHTPLQRQDICELPRPLKGRHQGAAMPRAPASSPLPPPWTELLAPALQGHAMGLMSEAGLPAVADPGHALVSAAHRLGLPVRPLSGPSALLLSLAASGLVGQHFAFVGYVPHHAGEREARLRSLEQHSRQTQQSQIVIETPYRNQALLDAMVRQFQPNTQLSISVAVTLPQAWTRSARISEWRRTPSTLPDRLPAVFCFMA